MIIPHALFHFKLRKKDKEKPQHWDRCDQDKYSAVFPIFNQHKIITRQWLKLLFGKRIIETRFGVDTCFKKNVSIMHDRQRQNLKSKVMKES